MHRNFRILLIALSVGLISVAQATAQHECGCHSSNWHSHDDDGYWQSWWKIIEWEPHYVWDVQLVSSNDEWIRLVDRVHTNHDCDPTDVGVSVTASVTHSVTVARNYEFGGNFEWAAGVLFAKTKVEAHAKVTFNNSWTDTNTETIEISTSKLLSPCKRVRYFFDKFRRDRVLVMDAADAFFTCKDFYTGETETFSCRRGKLKSTGTGWDEVQDGWVFMGKVCKCVDGSPVPLDPNDAGYDGKVPTPASHDETGGNVGGG